MSRESPRQPGTARPEVHFAEVTRFEGWEQAVDAVQRLIRHHRVRSVLEIGSGANPTLDARAVSAAGLDYTANDISESELAKADTVFRRLVLDVSGPSVPEELKERYDFIFSRMVNEHVEDGRRYFENIHRMLRPGGITAHWFSTLYALPFVVNKLMPESLSAFLLRAFAPRNEHRQGKFRAHYSWSRGPSAASIARFERLGFRVLRYDGYFGHTYYRRRLPLLHRLERWKSSWLTRHPVPALTSYAHVVLQRPCN